jgi:hypothetical protein
LYGEGAFFSILNGSIFWKKNGRGFFLSLYGEEASFLILNGSIFWKKNGRGFFYLPYVGGFLSYIQWFHILEKNWGKNLCTGLFPPKKGIY